MKHYTEVETHNAAQIHMYNHLLAHPESKPSTTTAVPRSPLLLSRCASPQTAQREMTQGLCSSILPWALQYSYVDLGHDFFTLITSTAITAELCR